VNGLIVRFLLFLFLFPISVFAHQLPNGEYEIIVNDGKKGLKNASGKKIIPPKYDDLGWSNNNDDAPIESIIGYMQNSKWGLMSLSNKKITLPEYAFLNKTKANFIIGGKTGKVSRSIFFGLFNPKGQVVVPFKYLSMQEAHRNLLVSDRVNTEKKYGLLSSDNQILLPIAYTSISPVSNELLLLSNSNGEKQLYNSVIKSIILDSLTKVEVWRQGYLKIYKGLMCGLVDNKGNRIAPIKYKDFSLENGVLKGQKYPKWEVFSAKNRLIETIVCDEMKFIGNKILISATNHQQILNQQFTPLTPNGFESILSIVGNKALYRAGNKYGIFDLSKQRNSQLGYDSLRLIDEFVYASNRINNKMVWAVYDTFGVKRSKFEYEQIREYDSKFFAVKRRGHWGFMNRNGKEIIHCVYDSVGEFIEDKTVVQFHGEYGVIDEESNWVVTPRKAKIEWVKDSLFLNRLQGKTSLEHVNGDLIYFTENKLKYKNDLLWEYRNDSTIIKIDLQGTIVEGEIVNNTHETSYIKEKEGDWVAVKIAGSFGFVDSKTRELKIANRYEEVGDAKGKLISVKIMGKWGAIDKNENIIIQPNYDNSFHFINKVAIMKLNNLYGLVNDEGKVVLAPIHYKIERQPSGRYITIEKGKFGLVDAEGRVLINNKYNSLQDLENGYVIIQKGEKFGVTTTNGVNTIPQIYDKIMYNPRTDSYFASTNQKWELLTDEE